MFFIHLRLQALHHEGQDDLGLKGHLPASHARLQIVSENKYSTEKIKLNI